MDGWKEGWKEGREGGKNKRKRGRGREGEREKERKGKEAGREREREKKEKQRGGKKQLASFWSAKIMLSREWAKLLSSKTHSLSAIRCTYSHNWSLCGAQEAPGTVLGIGNNTQKTQSLSPSSSQTKRRHRSASEQSEYSNMEWSLLWGKYGGRKGAHRSGINPASVGQVNLWKSCPWIRNLGNCRGDREKTGRGEGCEQNIIMGKGLPLRISRAYWRAKRSPCRWNIRWEGELGHSEARGKQGTITQRLVSYVTLLLRQQSHYRNPSRDIT